MNRLRLDPSGDASNEEWLSTHGSSFGPTAPNLKLINNAIYSRDDSTDTLTTLFSVDGMTEEVPNPHFQANQRLGDQLQVRIEQTMNALALFEEPSQARAAVELIQKFQGHISQVLPNMQAMTNAAIRNITLPARDVFASFWKSRFLQVIKTTLERRNDNDIQPLLAGGVTPMQPYTAADFDKWEKGTLARWSAVISNYKCETFPYTDDLIKFFLERIIRTFWDIQILGRELRLQGANPNPTKLADFHDKQRVFAVELQFVQTISDPRMYVWTSLLMNTFPYSKPAPGTEDEMLRDQMNRDLLGEIRRTVSPAGSIHTFVSRVLEPLLGPLAVIFSSSPRDEIANVSPKTLGFAKESALPVVLNSRLLELYAAPDQFRGYVVQIRDVLLALTELVRGREFSVIIDAISLYTEATMANMTASTNQAVTVGRTSLYDPIMVFLDNIYKTGRRDWGSVDDGLYMGSEQNYVSHKEFQIQGEEIHLAVPVRYLSQSDVDDKMAAAIDLSFATTFPNRVNAIHENMARLTHDLYSAERYILQWQDQVSASLDQILAVGFPDARRNMEVMQLRMDLQQLNHQAKLIRPTIKIPRTITANFYPHSSHTQDMLTFSVSVNDERTSQNTGGVYVFDEGKPRPYTFTWKVRQLRKPAVQFTMGSVPTLTLGIPRQIEHVVRKDERFNGQSALSQYVSSIGPGEVWCEVSNTDNSPVPKTLAVESARSTVYLQSQCRRTGRWYDPFATNSVNNRFGDAVWKAPNGIIYRGHFNAYTVHPVPYCTLAGIRGCVPVHAQDSINFDEADGMIQEAKRRVFLRISQSPSIRSAIKKALISSHERWIWLNESDIGSTPTDVEAWFIFSLPTENLDSDIGALRRLLTQPEKERGVFRLTEDEVNAIRGDTYIYATRMFRLEDLYNNWQIYPTHGMNAPKVSVFDPFTGWTSKNLSSMGYSSRELIEMLVSDTGTMPPQRTTFQGRLSLGEQYSESETTEQFFRFGVEENEKRAADRALAAKPSMIPSTEEVGAFLQARIGVAFR